MEISDLDQHPLANKIPVRLPVWWCRTGVAGPHPDVEGCTGKRVVLRFEKKFGRIERLFAKLMRAPHELRRPLLDKNSVLWELCNGRRTFAEVCEHMNATFHELSLIHISEPTRLGMISYAVFCLKKKT